MFAHKNCSCKKLSDKSHVCIFLVKCILEHYWSCLTDVCQCGFFSVLPDIDQWPPAGPRVAYWVGGRPTYIFLCCFCLFFCLYFSYFLRSDLSKNNVRVRGSSCTKQKYEHHQCVKKIHFLISWSYWWARLGYAGFVLILEGFLRYE